MISSGYNSQGGNSLTTQGLSYGVPSFGGGGLPFDPSAAIREKLRREAEQTAFENSLREREMRMREQQARAQKNAQAEMAMRQRQMDHAARVQSLRPQADPLARMKAEDRYEMSLRNAAKRPLTGFNMIGAYTDDPTKLPGRLRPQGSSFQGSLGPSSAGLSPEPEMDDAPTSNRGFDFADPYSQAQVQRAAFARR